MSISSREIGSPETRSAARAHGTNNQDHRDQRSRSNDTALHATTARQHQERQREPDEHEQDHRGRSEAAVTAELPSDRLAHHYGCQHPNGERGAGARPGSPPGGATDAEGDANDDTDDGEGLGELISERIEDAVVDAVSQGEAGDGCDRRRDRPRDGRRPPGPRTGLTSDERTDGERSGNPRGSRSYEIPPAFLQREDPDHSTEEHGRDGGGGGHLESEGTRGRR